MASLADRLLRNGFTARRSHTGVAVTLGAVSLTVTIDEKPMLDREQKLPNFATRQVTRIEVLIDDVSVAPRAGQSFIDEEAGRSHRITKVTRIGDYYECDCEPSEVPA